MIEYTFTTDACPVQAEGTIDGVPFYFRARGDHWRLTMGEYCCSIDPLPGQYRFYNEYDNAGWMPLDEARDIIKRCAEEYRNASTNL